MTKAQQIKKLSELVKWLSVYEKYLLKNGIQKTLLKYSLMSKAQIINDFCELKAELKACLRPDSTEQKY